MSHLSQNGIGAVRYVAASIRDALEERGVRVDSATALDEAFATGRAVSELERCLVLEGARSGTASTDALDFRPVSGGLEIRLHDGHVTRRFRVRRGKRSASGELVVTANSESALAREESPSLFRDEHWVLAFRLDDDHQLVEFVAAEIVGFMPGTPGRLVLGREFTIEPNGGLPPGRDEFSPVHEDLALPEDEEEFGEGAPV